MVEDGQILPNCPFTGKFDALQATGNLRQGRRLEARFDEDLAVLRLLRVDGTHYTATPIRRVAKEAPRSGDPLRALVTYKDEHGPRRIVVHLRALNIDASGDLIMDGLSFPGVSGSCIINESDEIVAIFAGTQHSALPVRERGYAVPVWGRKL